MTKVTKLAAQKSVLATKASARKQPQASSTKDPQPALKEPGASSSDEQAAITIPEPSRSSALFTLNNSASQSALLPIGLNNKQTQQVESVPNNSNEQQVASDQAAQMRSTLAIGHLIAAKTPSAGSRLIAQELRQFSSAVSQEFSMLLKEIAQLPGKLATTMKGIMDDDRVDRQAAGPRRSFFGSLNPRRLPPFRRPRRVSLMFARKSPLIDASTNTGGKTVNSANSNPTNNASAGTVSVTSSTNNATRAATKLSAPSNGTQARPLTGLQPQQPVDLRNQASKVAEDARNASQQSATGEASSPLSPEAAFALTTVFKHIWLPPLDNRANGYEGEADTDSSDSN